MKVFVYCKKTNETLATIENVISVRYDKFSKTIFINTKNSEHTFDTNKVKTRIYQN